jgi:UDP-2,4-diacetamido-2,4,6-trideoxy-beta-L-altropyranose hydrolase
MRPILLLRADAHREIGVGHFMRSFTLAKAWQVRGGDAIFLSDCDNASLISCVEESGIRVERMDTPHPNPMDLQQTLRYMEELGGAWVVVDGYHFDEHYHQEIRQRGYRLLVIDDYAHLDSYRADFILNQNAFSDENDYDLTDGAALLLGSRYALLRSEFLAWQEWARNTPKQVRNVLVTLGGSDPDNVTMNIIEAINRIEDIRLHVKVFIGPLNIHYSSLKEAVESGDSMHVIELCRPIADVAPTMAWADIALSAAGSTCWELAYMGLPSLLFVLAQNQLELAKGMERIGASIYISGRSPIAIAESLKALIFDEERRFSMCEKNKQMVDGGGAGRVVAAMLDRIDTGETKTA